MAVLALSVPLTGRSIVRTNASTVQPRVLAKQTPPQALRSSQRSPLARLRTQYAAGARWAPIRTRIAPRVSSSAGADSAPPTEDAPPPAWTVSLVAVTAALLPYVCPVATAIGLAYPPAFLWFGPELWAPGLGALMFAAAIKLRVADFTRVVLAPRTVALGLLANWTIKPLLALAFVKLLGLEAGVALGLLMVGAVSPSALTNYATGVALGSVALAVTLVGVSTVASVALTPALAQALIGQGVTVDPVGMAKTIVKVIVAPTVAGLALNELARPVARALQPFSGLVGLVATGLVLGGAVAMHGHVLFSPSGALMVPITVVYHALAYALAFALCRAMGTADQDTRAITLLTGMQSSTMATVLCTKFFADMPSAMITTVLSSVVMAGTGLVLGAAWGTKPPADN